MRPFSAGRLNAGEMTTNALQPPEVPTLMADASDLPDMLDAIIHKAYTPATAVNVEPTLVMRPEDFIAAGIPIEPSVQPEPVEGPAVPPAAPKRRVTEPVDVRAVAKASGGFTLPSNSVVEREELAKAVQRGWWKSGLVLGGLAAMATALGVIAWGALHTQSEPEQEFVRPPRLPRAPVAKKAPVEMDEEPVELTPVKKVKKPAAVAKPAPKEKASDLKRPSFGPETKATETKAVETKAQAKPAESKPARSPALAAKGDDAREHELEASDERLFNER
jgi:hypothetical protein